MARRLIGLLVLVQLLVVVIPLLGSEPGEKVKVAEGQYRYSIALGAGPEEYVEDWALSRTAEGYVVESEIRMEDRKTGEQVSFLDYFWLDSELRLMRWEFDTPIAELKPPRRPGCELNPGKLRCWDAEYEGRDFSVLEPYGIFPGIPLSAWFPMTWVHGSDLGPGVQQARMKLIVWDVGDGPDDLVPRELEIVDLGREKLRTEIKESDAQKTRVNYFAGELGEENVSWLVWISDEGLVLAWQLEGVGAEQEPAEFRGELVRYEKYAEFGPER